MAKHGQHDEQPQDLVEPTQRSGGGPIFVIGGREDKEGDREILKALVRRLEGRPLVVATLASEAAAEMWADYEFIFRDLGITHLEHLDIVHRDDDADARCATMVDKAGGVFFTGGDQLKISSKLGGTHAAASIRAMHRRGGVLAGTSAGASVMSETMLIGGPGAQSARTSGLVRMAPGLGFVRNVIIDQHFAQRGRLGRLLGAVAYNPRLLGIGVDEDTAALIEDGHRMRVLGSGAVYVVDAHGLSHTNVDEGEGDRALSLFDLHLHVLSAGNTFDLRTRRPCVGRSAGGPPSEPAGSKG